MRAAEIEFLPIGWGPSAEKKLQDLRKVLTGDAAKAMDELLGALAEFKTSADTLELWTSDPNSFVIVHSDGRKVRVTPDMTLFQPPSDASIDDVRRACEAAVMDPRQKDVPLPDRKIKVLVGVKSAYFDEEKKKWIRYQSEPQPVFRVLKLREVGRVVLVPPASAPLDHSDADHAATKDGQAQR
jgi:hypothetical protein